MRSLKKGVNIEDLVVGCYYGISTVDNEHERTEWLFEFSGIHPLTGEIMSTVTYYYDEYMWRYFGQNHNALCHNDEIVKGSLRKYTYEKFKKKING